MEEPDLEHVPAGDTVSSLLISAREGLGLSQKDVADMLFLQLAFIQRIDEGLFQKLPKQAYIKGYLRAYARGVGLDSDYIVKLYESEIDSDHSKDERDLLEDRSGRTVATAPTLKTGVVGLALIFVVVLLVWLLSVNSNEEESIDKQTSSDLVPQEKPATAEKGKSIGAIIDPPQVSRSADLNQVGSSTEGNNKLENSMSQKIEGPELKKEASISIQETKGISIQRSIEGGKEYIIVNAGGEDHIEFLFLGKCWVEVEDGEGYSIYGDLNGEKEILNIYGIAPFKVLLGRATEVKISYNGEDIDLLEYADNDQTTEIKLGTL